VAWDTAATAGYLDARMDAWWANAKRLKTGDGETRCISCHTAVPYALARPLLRQVQGIATPTSHEARLLDTVRQRIAAGSAVQPYYDQNESKQRESRGVEAVLSALVVTSAAGDMRAADREALTRAALSRLWDAQRPDGAWDWLDFGLEPYEAPDAVFQGATVAALAAGTEAGMKASNDDAGRQGLERLRVYLRSNVGAQRLFNQAWALLASSRLEGILNAKQRAAIVASLESRQRSDGGWSMVDLGPWRWATREEPFAAPGMTDAALLARSDAYATGLIVYALRQSGTLLSAASVQKGQQWLRSHQVPGAVDDASWAPWRAYSLNHDREHGGPRGEPWRRMFMSDLATAFASLALL
jgi:hypothetical protein